jgi:high affinity cGMP-specific 3',5'-cyclic phosphodiesterase 9
LENFHAASLFQLLRQRPDLNIFASLPRAKFKEVRKIIIECIIATDPAVHYEYVSKLAGKVVYRKKKNNKKK